jgi:Glucodextranase, domain N
LVGRDELGAHGKRDETPVWLANDGRFGVQGRKSERLCCDGYSAVASDCNVELHKNRTLISRFDTASDGNVVQCGEIGGIGADTTFTVAVGYGADAATALAATEGSLAARAPEAHVNRYPAAVK